VQARGLHEDHVLHRPSGEVHLPDMVKFKCSLGGLVADPDHQLAAYDAGEHVPAQEEGKAAEHLALGHFGVGGHDLPGAVGEVLVVGHEASRRLGVSKKRTGQGRDGQSSWPTATGLFGNYSLSQGIYCTTGLLY
jgi:hypothetical protein